MIPAKAARILEGIQGLLLQLTPDRKFMSNNKQLDLLFKGKGMTF